MVELSANPWDEYAAEFDLFIARREQADLERNPIVSQMLTLLGEVTRREVLDACCGEGFFSRILAAHGARVTGIDLSPHLIQIAQEKDQQDTIDFRVADLSHSIPELDGHFDLISSHLALNDVQNLTGFAATLVSLTKPGGRAVLSFNNPYSAVVREHVTDYFEPGAVGIYGGMWQQGAKAHYYHRTLEAYLDAFLSVGFRLAKLVDVPDRAGLDWLLPKQCRFPRFMILAFDKPF